MKKSEDENNRSSKIKAKFNSSNSLEKLSLINWYILGGGVAVVASISGGFGLYALLLIILGILTSCICPCIGLGIAGGAVGIWALLVIINIYTGIFTLGAMAILSPIGLVLSLFQKDKVSNLLIFSFIVQILISWIGLYFVYPLIELVA